MRVINWDKARAEQLRAAYTMACGGVKSHFTVEIEGHGKQRFDRHDARRTLEYLDDAFAKAEPVYPPNREGEEGQ